MPRIARQKSPVRLAARRAKLVAVVPAFNECRSIGSVVGELRALEHPAVELAVVVVDDGSSDTTRAEARAAGASRVISLPYNMGIGIAVQTGFRYALQHGADYVIQVDGDGQHVAGEIPDLLPAVLSGEADVVVGSRFVLGAAEKFQATTPLRWLAGRLLSWTIRVLTGQKIADTTSGFRLFSRRAAQHVADDYPDDYPEAQVLVNLAREGYRIRETHVTMRPRAHGRSSISGWRSIYYVIKVAFASFMDKLRSGS